MQDTGVVDRGQRAGDLARVIGGHRGLDRTPQPLGQTAGTEVLHRDVRVVVRNP